MKVFAIKSLVYVCTIMVITGILYPGYCYLIPNPRQHIYIAIVKSHAKKKVKKLIFGDSCSKQLYEPNEYKESVYSLATNQAISMVGQYVLLNNFIRMNLTQLPDEVCLIMDFNSFRNNLDQTFTYNYFLKPFFKEEFTKYFSSSTLSIIEKIPYHQLTKWPLVATSLWSPEFLQNHDNGNNLYISTQSNEYLQRMKRLCDRFHIKFRILPSIMPISKKTSFNHFIQSIASGIERTPASYFNNYFSVATFLPDSCFSDGIHLKTDFIPQDYYRLCE